MSYQSFVYCGGKCGSVTLTNTLVKNDFGPALHVHCDSTLNVVYGHIVKKTGCKTVEQLAKSQINRPIYVIDSFRNPLERLISSFFQNIERFLGSNYLNIDNKLINYFLFQSYKFEDYHPLDTEYPILRDIPFTSKYIRYEEDGIIYIKLRFKDINSWSEYLSEIFDKEIILYPDNLSENKKYSDKYKKFKENFKISQEMYDFFICHPIFIKYNSEEEQEEYKSYWLQRIESNEYFYSLLNDELLKVPKDFNSSIYGLINPNISGYNFNGLLHELVNPIILLILI